MPKRKVPEKTDISSAEWFRASRTIHDANILRKLIVNSSEWNPEEQQLDRSLFEKTYKLGSVPDKVLSTEYLERTLKYDIEGTEISIASSKRRPRGDTLTSQIQSLLPNNLDEKELQAITYAISRIVTERVPKTTRWPIVPIGLDALSAALLNLYIISNAVEQEISWIPSIWQIKIQHAKIEALLSIQSTLKDDSNREMIEQVLNQAIEKYNRDLGRNPVIDTEDPLSSQITGWKKTLTEKRGDLQEYIISLRKKVNENIGDIKNYSSSIKSQVHVHSNPITNWNILGIRADGPIAHEYDALLRLLRNDLNILKDSVVRSLCINLAHIENPGHPKVNDLKGVSDVEGRSAYYEMYRLEPLFMENYIPNLSKIGLRYRYIFTPRQRSGITSEGLIERLDFVGEEIRGCTVHIEPSWSKGPDVRQFSDGSYEAVAEREIVSLNLNHFNLKTGAWSTAQHGSQIDVKQRKSFLIQRTSQSDDKTPVSLTSKQTELLGLLWSLEGPRSQRKWLLDAVGYNQQTGNRNLAKLLKNRVLRLLYLPSLEFCKLPDGLVAYANCHDRRSRDELTEYIIQSQPFSQIFVGDSNDVVAHIRCPFKTSDTVAGNLKDKMDENSDNFFTSRLQERRTYRITTPFKLRDHKISKWKDPWKV